MADPVSQSPRRGAENLEDVLIEVIKSDLDAKEKRALLYELGRQRPATQNRWTVRGVIICVGLVALATPAFILFVDHNTANLPQALISLSSTALGALAGFLAPRGRQD